MTIQRSFAALAAPLSPLVALTAGDVDRGAKVFGARAERAQVVFATPAEISAFIRDECQLP